MRQIKYLCLFFYCIPAFASNTLTIKQWPETKCANCTTVQVYGLKLKVNQPIVNIVMIPSLGLNIELKNKKLFFSTAPKTSLTAIKDKLNVNSWIEYHELIATKSKNKKIEQLRSALEITKAKGFYKFANKKYTAFYIERDNAALTTVSELIIIPNNGDVVKVGGKFTVQDVEWMLAGLF